MIHVNKKFSPAVILILIHLRKFFLKESDVVEGWGGSPLLVAGPHSPGEASRNALFGDQGGPNSSHRCLVSKFSSNRVHRLFVPRKAVERIHSCLLGTTGGMGRRNWDLHKAAHTNSTQAKPKILMPPKNYLSPHHMFHLVGVLKFSALFVAP